MVMCTAIQVNRRVPDFNCTLAQTHTGAHVDRSGIRWGTPQYPYGMRRAPATNGSRKPTKKGHTFSARAADGHAGSEKLARPISKKFLRHLWIYEQRRLRP